jgi:hypothetical protein
VISEFETAFRVHLETADAEIRPYLGELDSAETMEGIINDSKQIIFYDLKGDTWEHQFKKRVEYSLYFVSATTSNSSAHRQKAKSELIQLIEKIDAKFLTFQCAGISEYPKQRTLKKLQDGICGIGYLVVYERTLDVTVETGK